MKSYMSTVHFVDILFNKKKIIWEFYYLEHKECKQPNIFIQNRQLCLKFSTFVSCNHNSLDMSFLWVCVHMGCIITYIQNNSSRHIYMILRCTASSFRFFSHTKISINTILYTIIEASCLILEIPQNIQCPPLILAPLINMSKGGCENKSALFILLIFHSINSQNSNLSLK